MGREFSALMLVAEDGCSHRNPWRLEVAPVCHGEWLHPDAVAPAAMDDEQPYTCGLVTVDGAGNGLGEPTENPDGFSPESDISLKPPWRPDSELFVALSYRLADLYKTLKLSILNRNRT
jgi:hypothetical protein